MKSIVVPASGDASDRPVFELAARLAALFDAHLLFVHPREDVVRTVATMVAGQVDGPVGLDDMSADLERDAVERADRSRHSVQAFCAEQGLPTTGVAGSGGSASWISVVGEAPDILVAQARTADAVVMAGGPAEAAERLSRVLVECGRPVLLAPTAPPPDLLTEVIVAWNDTAEAARAVTAATPLLARARSVAIMTVGDGDDQDAAASAERLAATLRRHAASVRVVAVPAAGRAADEALLGAARDAGATLLVMGGYSHSRLREMVFGGFTRDLLAEATIPVLIAH